MPRPLALTLGLAGVLACTGIARAQDPVPPTTGYELPPAETTPAPEPVPPAPAPAEPPPSYDQPAPPVQQPYPPPPPPGSYVEGYDYNSRYAEPLPPPKKPAENYVLPGFSIRVDPLNWLIYGRLGLELELGLWKFISIELVPVFVTTKEPPAINWSGREDTLRQESNGLGALSGSSAGIGFWLSGKAFEGYVLRGIITNYAYTYRAEDNGMEIDEVSHVDRHLLVTIGSMSRWGAFTLAGGFGLGTELNKDTRCPEPLTDSACDDDQLLIRTDAADPTQVHDLNSPFHPIQVVASFSLGVTLD